MSEGDIIRLNRMYKCALRRSISTPSDQQTVKFDLIVEDDIDDDVQVNDDISANNEVINDDLSNE